MNIQVAGVQYIIDSVVDALDKDPSRKWVLHKILFLLALEIIDHLSSLLITVGNKITLIQLFIDLHNETGFLATPPVLSFLLHL